MTASRDKHASDRPKGAGPRIRLGRHSMAMPGRRHHRVLLGTALLIGGVVGFLPIVGFWMIPLGLVVLSVDSHYVRRSRRKAEIRWGRWRRTRAKSKAQG